MDTDNKSGDDVRLEFNDIFNCGSDITQGNTQNDQHAGIEGGAESGNRRCQSPAIAIPQKGMPHHNKKRTYDINGADPSSGDPTPTVSTHVKPEADEAPFTGGISRLQLCLSIIMVMLKVPLLEVWLNHGDMVIPQNGATRHKHKATLKMINMQVDHFEGGAESGISLPQLNMSLSNIITSYSHISKRYATIYSIDKKKYILQLKY